MATDRKFGAPTAAKSILDTDELFREKIEAANNAMLEVIRMAHDTNSAIAPNLLGVPKEAIAALGSAPRSKLLKVVQTGVPLFSLRLTTQEDVSLLLTKGWTEDQLFHNLLSGYSEEVPLRTI